MANAEDPKDTKRMVNFSEETDVGEIAPPLISSSQKGIILHAVIRLDVFD